MIHSMLWRMFSFSQQTGSVSVPMARRISSVDMYDGIVTGVMDSGVHGTAAAVPHHDMISFTPRWLSGVFDAAQLKICR